MVAHPEVLSDKIKHNKMILLLKTMTRGVSTLLSVPRLRGRAHPRPSSKALIQGPVRYWLLQPCEPEEPPACFFLRLLSSRLLEVFRSLICTWS